MDSPQRALDDLREISSQIESAVLLDSSGALVAATGAGGERLAGAARELLAAAVEGRAERGLAQLEAAMHDGSVFVVRDGERTIVATTAPEPTVGLVFYDLKTALRAAASEDEAGA